MKGKRRIDEGGLHVILTLLNKRMISRRLKIIQKRLHLGYWEGDTIVGIKGGSKQAIFTTVERKSGYLPAKKVEREASENMLAATQELFGELPKHKRKTITYDNGSGFSRHEIIEIILKIRAYFANAYHSWGRWTNENTNSLLQ